MSDNAPTLQLRPAVRRPVRRQEIAIAATVLVASATGGVIVALLQPRETAPIPAPVALSQPMLPPQPVAVASQPAVEPTALFDVAPVIHEGGLRVVVQTELEPQWVGEGIQVRDQEGVRVVVRPVSETARVRFGQLVGSRLRLHGESGASCLAVVTGLVAVGRFAPEDLVAPDSPADTTAAWETADSSHLLAGDLIPIAGEGDCAGATWAQPERMPSPAHARISDAGAEQTRVAVEALQKTADYPEATGSSKVTFSVTSIATEAETLLMATAMIEGCADQEPVTTALFAIQPDGSLHQVGSGLDIAELVAAADFDGDGRVEMMIREDALDSVLLRRRAGGYQVEARAEVPIFGCRC